MIDGVQITGIDDQDPHKRLARAGTAIAAGELLLDVLNDLPAGEAVDRDHLVQTLQRRVATLKGIARSAAAETRAS